MSTFSGLSTALSSLNAQRQALEVSGQNVANANTVGYTRQRADLVSVESASTPSRSLVAGTAGNGVRVAGVTRLGDVFLDARLRGETGSASFAATRSDVLTRLESTVAEPSDTGLSHALQTYWAAWEDLGNNPGSASARAVLLERTVSVADRITTGYAAIATQWSQARTELGTAVGEVNSTAQGVASLNEKVLGVLAAGGSANELIDQRNVMVLSLSRLVGATATERPDGSMDVMVGGNALVRGAAAHAITITDDSARSLETADAGTALEWAASGMPLESAAGRVMGLVTALAPAGDRGILATAAQWYDDTAVTLMTQVNTLHRASYTVDGVPGGDVFTTDGRQPAARYLRAAVQDGALFAVSASATGGLDASRADDIAQLGTQPGGPDALWSASVVELGITSRTAGERAGVAESARVAAEKLQLAGTSVDIDEESVNMLAYQRAYEGAARVLTAIDEMLDTLINRTGVVGR